MLDGTVLPKNNRQDNDVQDALDMLIAQPETPPFVSRLLIQRLTHSNPSANYRRAVAEAFAGNEATSGKPYASGVRGDLEAVIKTILLRNEATSLRVLKIRDNRGRIVAVEAENRRSELTRLREPVLRLTAMIRAFGGKSNGINGRFHLGDMTEELRQSPFKSPSVFNFYLPDFQPAGPMLEAELYGPEFEILTSVAVNQVHNLMRDGIHKEALELPRARGQNVNIELNLQRPYRTAQVHERDRHLDAIDDLMEELDLLLCGGTLREETKQIIIEAIRSERATTLTSRRDNVKSAITLLLTSPDCAIAN